METKSFAYSTTKITKTPITQPSPNQYYNCRSRNIVYLITCKYQKCCVQYVEYSMRQLRERFFEHKTSKQSPVRRHCLTHQHFNKLTIQILTQAPTTELYLKHQEYYWICILGTLTKFNPRGLNN